MTSAVTRLIIRRIVCDPFLMDKTARRATLWVKDAIAAVKAAPDNPYGDDDEAIAAAILAKIEEKK